MARILLIDDDADFSRRVRARLEKAGYGVACLERAEGAPNVLATGEFDLVLLDNNLPGMSGLEFMGTLQERGIRLPVILMTFYSTSTTAIDATKLGAYAYVIKPLDIGELFQELERLIVSALKIDWRGERVRMPGRSAPDSSSPKLIGESKCMIRLYEFIALTAKSDVPVLIRGETGTGKELVARYIRAHGARKDEPLVVVNCSAFDEDRLDDELFGHEPGAILGADKLRKGSFEHADGGTLFLDEVGELPLRIQGKLLGALESHTISRRGSNEAVKVNVRLLAASQQDLEAAMRQGTFRSELFYRLAQMHIDLPPLRERGKDLELLVQYFLTRVAEGTGQPVLTLHQDAWGKLRNYAWPGNIWELQNVIGRAALVCRGPQILATDLAFDARPSPEGEITDSIRRAVQAALQSGQTNLVERLRGILNQELLLLAVSESGGDQERAARILGIPLHDLLVEKPGGPDTVKPNEYPLSLSWQAKAVLLIANNPRWTVEQVAKAVGRSRSTLHKDPIVKRALKERSAGKYRPPPGAHRSTDDDPEDDDT
jgi:DNA-binding NtrC family response regulator